MATPSQAAKRPRLSPTTTSVLPAPPAVHQFQPPFSPSVFSPPAFQPSAFQPSTFQPSTFHQPQPLRAPRPKDPRAKPDARAGADLDVLSDVLVASGIDLGAEEAALRGTQTVAPVAYRSSGPISEAATQGEFADEVRRKHTLAARELAESQQFHLTDPFVLANVVRRKLAARAYEHGVSAPHSDAFVQAPMLPPPLRVRTMTAASGEAIAVATAPAVVDSNAPFVDLVTLVSLATQEHLRTLLESAVELSQSRQAHSRGVVPPAWVPLATGRGPPQPATAPPAPVSNTAWDAPDSAVSPRTVGQQPDASIAFPNPVARALRESARAERKLEEERVARREMRNKAAAAATESAAVATATAMASQLPDRLSKKERDRLSKQDTSDDVLHRKANETARMQLGLGKKQYSWMQQASAASPRPSSAGPAGAASPLPAPRAADRWLKPGPKLGAYHDDGPAGRRVQLTDLAHALELHCRNHKACHRVSSRQE